MKRLLCLIAILILFPVGCAPIISRQFRESVSPGVRFRDIIKNPEAYKGDRVILSGIILDSKNSKHGTLIEVLEKPADREGRPRDVDRSDGRFLALYDSYLDCAIYAKGREVVIAGKVIGKKKMPIGEIEYTYPLISIKEIHLFKSKNNEEKLYPYPYPPPWIYYPYWYW